MSYFAVEKRIPKNNQKIMKKIKLPTSLKSKKCSISKCGKLATNHVTIGAIQIFHLCKPHFDQYCSKNESHPVIFTRGKSWL